MHSRLVILYFARRPKLDLKQSAFDNRLIHRQVATGMHEKTVDLLRQTGLPVLLSDETNQVGNSLAERLTNAIKNAFAKGYEQVIAIGNDCPDLDHLHIQSAKAILESGRNVLGPAADGGDYLIGISRLSFDPIAFQHALSEKSEVHQALRLALLQNGQEPAELDCLIDIDDTASLFTWLNLNKSKARISRFVRLLLALLLVQRVYVAFSISAFNASFLLFKVNRGPPHLVN